MDEIPVTLTIQGTPTRVLITPAELARLDGLPPDRQWRTGTPIRFRDYTTGSARTVDASQIAPRP